MFGSNDNYYIQVRKVHLKNILRLWPLILFMCVQTHVQNSEKFLNQFTFQNLSLEFLESLFAWDVNLSAAPLY